MASSRFLLSALALTLCAAVSTAQFSDTCATAGAVTTGITAFDNSSAGTDGQGLLPLYCDMGLSGDEQIYQDLWATFTPPQTKNYEISTVGLAGFDTRLAIYDQATCPDDPTLVIACNDDFTGAPFEAGVVVPLSSTSTYLVRLGSYDLFTGGAAGSLSIGDPVSSNPPVNDDCNTASPISNGLTPFDTSNATDGSGLPLDPLVCDMGPFGDEQIYQDVWFSFTPTETRIYAISSLGLAGFDSRLAIYEQATCPEDPNLVVDCNDDATATSFEARLFTSLDTGATYLVRYGSYDATTAEVPGALSIEPLVQASPPSNDNCANATVLPINFAVTNYDGTGATTDGADSAGFCDYGLFGDEQSYNDIWFSYTPIVGGCTYISTLDQAGIDTRLTVYSSPNCPDDPANIIACADDEILAPPTAPFEAGLDVDLVAGQTYLIRVGTYSPSVSNAVGNLVVSVGPQAEANGGGANSGAPGCGPPVGFEEFCTGDGGDQLGCTNCPCGNNAPAGTVGGCLNSVGQSLRLIGSGDPSTSLPPDSTTDLRFALTGAPAGAFCILTSGNSVAPGGMANPCFGQGSGVQAVQFDGLRCAIHNTRRHGGRSADSNGNVGGVGAPWGGEGGPPVGIAEAGVNFIVGQTRYFQVISRDDPLLGCMRGLNTTQAVQVTFTR